jgi:hypothetical protein
MENNEQSVVSIYNSNTQLHTETLSDVFLVDVTSTDGGFISTERTAATTYDKKWNGYIYEFVLYQS